jgi:antitoxin ParD1/3/4
LLPKEEIGMFTLNVVLSDRHEALIADLVESGQFHNANDVLQEGLRLVEANHQQDARKEQKMRQAIQAGLDDLDQGSFVTLKGRDEIALHLRNLGTRARGNPIPRSTCKIPWRLQEASGHDFSRAASSARRCWALAPASLCFQLFAIAQWLKPESQ